MLPKKIILNLVCWGLLQILGERWYPIQAQVVTDTGVNIWPCGIYPYFHLMDPQITDAFPLGVSYLERLPYLSPEKTQNFGIKRFSFYLKRPHFPTSDRRFVLDQAPDTVHVMDFDRQGRMTDVRSLDLVYWLVQAPNWQNIFGEVRTESLEYDSLGRLTKRRLARLNRQGEVWLEEEYKCRYLDTAVVWTRSLLESGQSLEYGGLLSKGWICRLNDSGQTQTVQPLVEAQGWEGTIDLLLSQPQLDYRYDANGRVSGWQYGQEAPTECVYGKAGKLLYLRIRPQNARNASDIRWQKCRYDSRGNLISLRREDDGTQFNWTWDERGIPNSHSFPHPAYPQRQITYQIEVEFWD